MMSFGGNDTELFEEDPEDEWAVETLKWRDKQVYVPHSTASIHTADSEQRETALPNLHEQHKKRWASLGSGCIVDPWL